MRIVATHLTPVELALVRPLRTARATYTERRGFLVGMVDEQGHVGQGEAMPLPEFGTEAPDECAYMLRRVLAAIRGVEICDRVEALERALVRLAAPASRHGVEQALLDLLAQRQQVPLCRLLNPRARAFVRVCALLTEETPEALASESALAVSEGFSAVKLKVAGRPLELDEARVRMVREAVGPHVGIRLDANGGWSEREALRAVEELARHAPELCEQPVPAEAVAALGRVQRGARFPLAADEALASSASIAALLGGPRGGPPAVQVFVLKPMILGGLLAAHRLARQAASFGIDTFVSSSLDGVVARAGATHLAAALPSGRLAAGLGVGRLFVDEMLADHPFQPVRGRIRLPPTPGLGAPS